MAPDPPSGPRAISFQHAAAYYDATRALPAPVMAQMTAILTAELTGRGRCLEIGVGTGRIALPLHQAGVPLLGTDIAPAMLERLAANAGGAPPFPLLLADATRLPLASGSLGAVLACHVLHLIPGWRTALDEVMRVLRPGGVLLADMGSHGAGFAWSEPSKAAMARHGIQHRRPGAEKPGEVRAYLEGVASPRRLAPVSVPVRRSLAIDLADWENQIHSWTWAYSPGQMRQACDEVRAWAAGTGWPLDREVEATHVIQWWAFDRSTGQPGSGGRSPEAS